MLSRIRERWQRGRSYWRQLPFPSKIPLVLAVFLTWAGVNLIVQTMYFDLTRTPVWFSVLDVVLAGLIGLGYFLFLLRGNVVGLMIWTLVTILANNAVRHWVSLDARGGTLAAPHPRAFWLSVAALGCVLGSYVSSMIFIGREARRYLRIFSEVELAGSIQRSLVPQISCRRGRYEIFGASVPSGRVGGDLVDLCEGAAGWIGYVADVSGHGVPAGVLMAMVKSAVRTALAGRGSAEEMLATVNRVLQPIIGEGNFVTFASLSATAETDTLAYLLAGHLPVIQFQAATGSVVAHDASNLPLGLFAEVPFHGGTLRCQPGDLLVVLTDGFTEALDADGREFGLEGIEHLLAEVRQQPLPQIFRHLCQRTEQKAGVQDDRTLLLVRCLA